MYVCIMYVYTYAYLPLPHTSDETSMIRHSNSKPPLAAHRSFARRSFVGYSNAQRSRQAPSRPPSSHWSSAAQASLRRPLLTFADGRAFHREQRRYRYGNGSSDGDGDNDSDIDNANANDSDNDSSDVRYSHYSALGKLPADIRRACADSDSFLQFLVHVPATSGELRKCSCLVARHIAYVCVYFVRRVQSISSPLEVHATNSKM